MELFTADTGRSAGLICSLALSLSISQSPTCEASALRPYTVDDALKVEEIGPGEFNRAGTVFVFVQRPPFDQYPDFSLTFTRGPQFGQLMWTTMDAGAKPQPLLPIDPKAIRALVSLSPSGRYVAFLEAKDGDMRLGAVDMTTKQMRMSDALPQETLQHDLTPIWIDEGRLLFVARESGELPPYVPFMRRSTGEAMAAQWRKAWSGVDPSPSVYRSRRDGGANAPFKGRLVEFDIAAGKTSQWAQGLFSNFRLSPDKTHVAAVRQFEKSQAGVEERGGDWLYGRGQLLVFEVATGKSIDVAPKTEILPGTLEWSMDSARIGFFAWPHGQLARDGLFHTFAIRTRQLKTLPHTGLDLVNEREFGPPGKPLRFVWMGTDIAVPARINSDADPKPRFSRRGVTGRDLNAELGRFDWFLLSERRAPKNLTAKFKTVSPWAAGMAASGAYLLLDDEVQRVDRMGHATSMSPGLKVDAQPLTTTTVSGGRSAYGSHAVYRAQSSNTLHTFDYARGTVAALKLAEGEPELVAITQAGDKVAYREIHSLGTDLTIHLAAGQTLQVAQVNQWLAQIAQPINRSISYTGTNGEQVTSCVTLPQDYVAGKKYPTMVYVYPSARLSCPKTPDLQGFSYENRHPLVAAGYALLRVSAPMIATREAGPLANIVAATDLGIDAAVAKGYVDPNRLGLIGASGAGFSGVWIAGHSKRFKALVSINGIANIQSHYFSTGISELFYPHLSPWNGQSGRYESLDQFGLGFTPWDDVSYYWKISPIAHAHNIDIPVLLVSTDMDVGGFSQQYDEMFVALHRLRKEVEYVKYWGEGHGPVSPANVRDLTRRTLELFDRYLKE